MSVNKISNITRKSIIDKSVNPLPNNPSRMGYTATEIKGAMFKFVTDEEDSVISEINRVVEEVNNSFSENDSKYATQQYVNENGGKIDKIELDGVEQEIRNKVAQIALPSEVVKDSNYVHTDNNFNDSYKNRLESLNNYDDEEVRQLIQENKQDISSLQTNKANVSAIPDVSSFITKDVNNLTNYTLSTGVGSLIELTVDNDYVVTINLKNSNGQVISTDDIDLPLESVVVDANYNNQTKEITLTLENGNTTSFSVGDLVRGLQSEITVNNKLPSDLVDDSDQAHKFTTLQEKQVWNNKQDNIEDLETIRVNSISGKNANDTIAEYGDIVTHNTSEFVNQSDVPTKLSDLTEDITHRTVTDNEKATWNSKLSSFTETDPTVPSHVKSITEQDITNWNNKVSSVNGDVGDVMVPIPSRYIKSASVSGNILTLTKQDGSTIEFEGGSGESDTTILHYKHAWVRGTSYAVNDVVLYGGQLYLSKSDNNTTTPSPNGTDWVCFSRIANRVTTYPVPSGNIDIPAIVSYTAYGSAGQELFESTVLYINEDTETTRTKNMEIDNNLTDGSTTVEKPVEKLDKAVTSSDKSITNTISLTKAEYDALETKDENTIYIISEYGIFKGEQTIISPLVLYPIGSVYYNAEDNTDPAVKFGGSWMPLEDCFLWCVGDTKSITYTKNGATVTENLTAGTKGGEFTHKLIVNEIPSHSHATTSGTARNNGSTYKINQYFTADSWNGNIELGTTTNSGGNGSHNNMPPYLAVYAWKRVENQ